MAEIKTHADSIRVYLTGAVTAGDAQLDSDLSLGNERSSEELHTIGIRLINPMRGVWVEFASGENGAGNGKIEAVGADALRWSAPGEAAGASVTISNGETKVLESATASKFIRVRRASTEDLSGSMVVRLSSLYNNVLGFRDVTSAERTAGCIHYRCLCFKNESAGSVTNLKVWRDSASSALAVAYTARLNGLFPDQTVAGETVVPAGLTWNTGTAVGTGLQIGTLTAGAEVAVWLRRTIAAEASATPLASNQIHWSYDA